MATAFRSLLLALIAILPHASAQTGGRQIVFSGYEWTVKSGESQPLYPGPNYFSDSTENVWVDANGRLHLKISFRAGRWWCPEIVSKFNPGYGTYRIYAETDPASLDLNAVFGFFTWSDDPAYNHREIDIEFSRWGQPLNRQNANFVVQPAERTQNSHLFRIPSGTGSTTHSFRWEGDRVVFQSIQGHAAAPATQNPLLETWTFLHPRAVPPAGDERVRMNLWLFRGLPPSGERDVEFVIRKFEFEPGGPGIHPDGVVNAASYQTGAVSPGEIITIFGKRIGPQVPALLRLTPEGMVSTLLAGVRVLFGDLPAPLLYASSSQVTAVVPFGVAGRRNVPLVVEHEGRATNAVTQPLTQVRPGVFTLNSSGQGQGAIINQDGTINGGSNPARPGSILSIFATGSGMQTPDVADGQVTGMPLSRPLLPVSVLIDGVAAEVLSATTAPGLVAGVLQVNAAVPATTRTGSSIPVVIRIGDTSSREGVTLAVGQAAK